MKILITESQLKLIEGVKLMNTDITSGHRFEWLGKFKEAQRKGLTACYVDRLKVREILDKSHLPHDRMVYFVPKEVIDKWNVVAEKIVEKIKLYDELIHSLLQEKTVEFFNKK